MVYPATAREPQVLGFMLQRFDDDTFVVDFSARITTRSLRFSRGLQDLSGEERRALGPVMDDIIWFLTDDDNRLGWEFRLRDNRLRFTSRASEITIEEIIDRACLDRGFLPRRLMNATALEAQVKVLQLQLQGQRQRPRRDLGD